MTSQHRRRNFYLAKYLFIQFHPVNLSTVISKAIQYTAPSSLRNIIECTLYRSLIWLRENSLNSYHFYPPLYKENISWATKISSWKYFLNLGRTASCCPCLSVIFWATVGIDQAIPLVPLTVCSIKFSLPCEHFFHPSSYEYIWSMTF